MNRIRIFKNAGVTKNAKFLNLVTQRLKEVDPVAFQECVDYSIPKINDHTLIPWIIDKISTQLILKPENYPLIFATIYYLIAPYKIIQQDNKLPVGFRDLICIAFGFSNPESVSMHSQNLDVYWKNPRFKAKVTDLAEVIYHEYKTEVLNQEDEWQPD